NRYLPFVTQVVERKYSEDLNSIIASYEQEFGYDYVDEFFITNAYGANVVLVFGKADYIQFDKPWWKTTKQESSYIGSLGFQEKYNSYSLPLGLKITSDSNEFLGTIRVLVRIDDLLSDFINNANLLEKEGKQIILVDRSGQIIYSNGIAYSNKEHFPYFS
ncbi:MAG: histidine kinase, partial [Nitrosopumilaceae archaeon]|nr:histidine kinase [Nitrosopumilaceae archaeon]NIU87435.1 histidine kinase [Nitrosopumilaceae archaeon]NIV65953.1 histidine kinase [Nitrosopumilaceae archaeon]NIX63248.1 histidine kinase [Nitrosopumilaceae archaeon]